jgi:sigma-70, region 4
MTEVKFSTLTLLTLASEVEAAFPDQFIDQVFNLDRLLEVLNNDKIFSDRDRRIIYLCFERDMTFDEINPVVNVPTETVRYTIDIMYQKLFCFSKVYRSNKSIEDIAAYKLLDEGDTYLKLFGNKTYYEVAREYVRNERKFDLQMIRAHATIVALTLGFAGKELDDRYILSVERVSAEKFDLRYLNISMSDSSNEATAVFRPYPGINTNIEKLQNFLYNVLSRKVTDSEESD